MPPDPAPPGHPPVGPYPGRGFSCLLLFLAMVAALPAGGWGAPPAEAPRSREQRIAASRNFRDGAFRNLLPTHLIKPGATWSMIKRQFGDEVRVPPNPVPVVHTDPSLFVSPPETGLRITWLGHATVLVEIDGKRILTDPMFSRRASPFGWVGPARLHPVPLTIADLPPLDAVVISHNHYDHLDEASIRALAPKTGRFVVPLGNGGYLEDWGVPPEKIVELDWWEETTLASSLRLVACPARHYSGRSLLLLDGNENLWACWAMIGPRHRVFFSGDTGIAPTFKNIGARLGPFDASLIKIGAYDITWEEIHMNPEQAVQVHQMLRGGLLVPVHWATFNLANHDWAEPAERLMAAGRKAGIPFFVPRPGEPVIPGRVGPNSPWWRAVMEPRAE